MGKGLAFLGFRNTVLTTEKIIVDGLSPLHGGFPTSTVVKTCLPIRSLKKCEFNPWVRKIPWRRTWQPTTVFLSGKFHGQRSLVGYSPRGHKRVRHGLVTKYQLPPPTPGHCSVSRFKQRPCLPVKMDCLLIDAACGTGFRFAACLKTLEAASGRVSSKTFFSPAPSA